jgi:hypothetical protein
MPKCFAHFAKRVRAVEAVGVRVCAGLAQRLNVPKSAFAFGGKAVGSLLGRQLFGCFVG